MRTNIFKRTLKIIKVRYISVFAFLLVTGCLVLFMNCSLNETPVNSETYGSVLDETPPYKYTENPSARKFPDPDDPETKEDIVTGGVSNDEASGGSNGEADDGFNIDDWEKTSEITEIDINIENGQICISHTKAGQWTPTQNVSSPSVEDPVEGNAWVVVPLDGKGYAAPYDWLGAEGPCHMLDVETLENLYQQLPQRTNMPELNRWKPVPGDKIGFMVSGLARDGFENVKERSNMLIVTLPDAEGEIPLEVEEPCSEDSEGSFCSESCNVPNRITVIESIEDRFPNQFIWIHQLYTKKASEGAGSLDPEDERWEFIDRVGQVLSSMDDRFGHTCVNGNCNDISTHQISYKCEGVSESSEASENMNVATISIRTADGKTQWQPDASQDVTVEDDSEEDQISVVLSATDNQESEEDTEEVEEEEGRSTHGWIYPRREGLSDYSDCIFLPESFKCQELARIRESICAGNGGGQSSSSFNPDSFSWDQVHWLRGGVIYSHDISEWTETSRITSFEMNINGFCMDHTKRMEWKENYRSVTWQGVQHIIIPYNGGFYGRNFDVLNLPDDSVGSMCGHHMRYHRDQRPHGELGEPIAMRATMIAIVGAIKKIWLGGGPQRGAIAPIRNWHPSPGDVLGLVVSTPTEAREDSLLKERSDIVWVSLPNYCQDQRGGEIVGRTSSLNDDDDGDLLPDIRCTEEQIESGYATHIEKDQCLPQCITFGLSNADGVEIGEGNACDDISYYTLPIENTFEDKCCRRYSKSSCPPGYRKFNGNCYPTCQRAAELAGYTNKAGHNRAGNYVLHEKQTFANDANCRDLDEYGPNGYGDWKDFSFYDPYTFSTLRNNSDTIYEIVKDPDDDYLCCVRATSNSTKAASYGTDGWTAEERNRFPTTSTTTTTR